MKRGWFSSLVLLAFASLIGLIIAEITVRILVGSPLAERLPLVRVKADPEIGWVMVPHDVHFTYHHLVKLNAKGFRGPEIQGKQEREYRILVLGNSHVYGQGLGDQSLVTSVLQENLNKLDRECYFNVINMGVRAYSINNELAALKKIGIPLQPDHVILFIYINDFQPTDIKRKYAKFSEMDWYTFDFSSQPTQEIIDKWGRREILRKSALIMWIHDIYYGVVYSNNIENQILKGMDNSETSAAIRYVEESLREFTKLANDHSFNSTLAVIPVVSQLMADYPDERYQSEIKKISGDNGLDLIDLLPMFKNHYEQSGRLPVIPHDSHYDREGHRIMAEALAKHVSESRIRCE